MAQRAKFVPENKELISNSDEAASVPISKTIAHFKKNLNFEIFNKQETDKPLGDASVCRFWPRPYCAPPDFWPRPLQSLGDARGSLINDDEEFFIRYSISELYL